MGDFEQNCNLSMKMFLFYVIFQFYWVDGNTLKNKGKGIIKIFNYFSEFVQFWDVQTI